jgi:hypothetical protein
LQVAESYKNDFDKSLKKAKDMLKFMGFKREKVAEIKCSPYFKGKLEENGWL